MGKNAIKPIVDFLEEYSEEKDVLEIARSLTKAGGTKIIMEKKQGEDGSELHLEADKDMSFGEAYMCYYTMMDNLVKAMHRDLVRRAIEGKIEIDNFHLTMGMLDLYYSAMESSLGNDDSESGVFLQGYQMWRLKGIVGREKAEDILNRAGSDVAGKIYKVDKPIYQVYEEGPDADDDDKTEVIEPKVEEKKQNRIIGSFGEMLDGF